MKTTTTIKHALLALTIALSIVSCKKDPEPTPPAEVKAIALTDLKALSTGASVKVPDAKKITGVIISDASGKNIDSKSIVLQDAGTLAGIIISFDAAPTFAAGDQVEINISNQTLAQLNGEIVLQNIPIANAKKTGTGTITAKTTTAAEIITNKAAWDGTLVTIPATELTGGSGKYTGTLTIKDASGTVTSNVLAGASFENTAYPVSVSSVSGIVRVNGNDTRIDIRKPADVSVGAITRIVTEDFSTMTPIGATIDAAGFTTPLGQWSGRFTSVISAKDVTADAAFTTPGKTYPFVFKQASVSYNPSGLHCSFTNLSGLKTVTVTFAITKATTFNYSEYGDFPLDAFDPSVDYVQAAIVPELIPMGSELDKFLTYSPKYTTTGQFNTFTWTVPTQEELVAAGLSATAAADYLKNPTFTIVNANKSEGGNSNLMFFDKIVFGFGN